ncbi:MAG: transcriptional regulator [bacterium]
MMYPKAIRNEAEYEAALARVSVLMDAEAGSPQEAELERWGKLVELYEEKMYPIGLTNSMCANK